MLNFDIITDIKFHRIESNGRKSATPANYFGCVFLLDGKKYDCRLWLKEIGSICPGDFKKNIPIKFLCPELVMSKLTVGKSFYLWEMRNIAEGKVVKVINNKYQQTNGVDIK